MSKLSDAIPTMNYAKFCRIIDDHCHAGVTNEQ